MKLYVKYMACESCKVVVREALKELEFTAIRVELGEIETKETLTDEDKAALNKKIKKAGLEILENKTGRLLEQIKQVMVAYVYHSDEKPIHSFSELISKELNYSYGYLANFFSEVEATTIEKYIIAMKIERVKELIMLEDASIKEISYLLHYSSAAHLSNQFKKITGLTPTHFKALKEKRRLTIQDL